MTSPGVSIEVDPPLVSVIVPTYQRRDYVGRAVASVLAQTYRDFELIVIDDGSTDGTEQALAGLDPRLSYHWQENRGTGAARNAGLQLARGEIVAFLDSDNQWLPHHLALVTEVFQHFPDAVLVCTCYRQHVAGRQPPREARLIDFLPLAYLDVWAGLISCMAVKKDELFATGGFDESLEVLEDNELLLRLAERGPFAVLQHRSIIHQVTRGSRLERGGRIGAMLTAFEAISQSGLDLARETDRPDRADLLARADGRMHYSTALRALGSGDDELVRTHLEKACLLMPELSDHPEVIARRIARSYPSDRARCLARAAVLWPDQRSDTAIFLRLRASTSALRSGRPLDAGRLLLRLPVGSAPSFAFRNRDRWALLIRQAARRYRSRAPASPADPTQIKRNT